MSHCVTTASLYEDIEFCMGKNSLPGIRPHVYGISMRDVSLVPAPDAAPETLQDVAVIKTNFVLKESKKWHKLDLVINDGQFTCESQGTYGSKTFLNTVTVNMPGTQQEATAYASEVNNDAMLYLVPQRDGKYRLFGSAAFPAEVAPSLASGQSATDSNQTTLTITATDLYPAPFYEGTIVTENGNISGKDGSEVVGG